MNFKYINCFWRSFLVLSSFVVGCCAKAQTTSDTITISTSVRRQAIEPGQLLNITTLSSTAAVSTVAGETLHKTPAANITNTLYGRLAGLTVQQGSGEPGYDGAALSIRGTGTYDNAGMVIYVDGFQTNASYFQYLSTTEIESITILKDAAALASFGMRGANGVLWIVTKRGTLSKPTLQFQARTGVQQAININKPLDAYGYASLYNEAISNDAYGNNGHQFIYTPKYSQAQLDAYKKGTGINVDWYDEVLNKSTPYTDGSLTFTGGDETTKYTVVADFMQQLGLYDVPVNSTQSNARIQRFNLRSNLDFNFFKIFEARIDLGGRIEDRRYANYSGPSLWNDLATYPSNIYPVKDSSGNWSGTSIYPNNPAASLNALGWVSTHDRTLQANFNLKEKLDFITPGLYLNEAASFNTWTRSTSSKTATYSRYYNGQQTTTDKQTDIVANGTTPTNQYDWKQALFTAGYDRSFGLHQFNAGVNYLISSYVADNNYQPGSGLNRGNQIFYHYENLGGRFHYMYNNKYLAEFGFGYSGSDNFAPGNKWGFYPAGSLAWIVSNEDFLKSSSVINLLKLRASVGKTGNELSNNGRYLFQQYYVGNGTFYTGNNGLTSNAGTIPSYFANPGIFAEHSVKYNIGIDATFFNKLSITADVFEDRRGGIVTIDNSYAATLGTDLPYSNVGKVTNKGFEVTATYSGKSGAVGYFMSGLASYAKNKIDYLAEVAPVNAFSASTGQPIGITKGLIADGLYQLTDFDSNGNLNADEAFPGFGAVQPGDIKYKDLDGNGRVDQNDITKIGNPSLPTLTYAFNAGVSFKGFDLSVLLQGANSGTSFNLLSAGTQTIAFVNNGNAYALAQNAWAYYPDQGIDTRTTAMYPRLTTVANANNYQASTFWMKKNNFLRIRNIELGYDLPSALLSKAHIDKLRIYVTAVNPVIWSSLLKTYNLDPETPMGYPALKSYTAGLSLTF